MWASWCLGSIGGLAEVVRRGDSVGKRDINRDCREMPKKFSTFLTS